MPDIHLLAPEGFSAGTAHAGIRIRRADDVGLLIADRPVAAAAVFTTNTVAAAPVLLGRRHIAAGKLRGIVVNAGIANACTGPQGEKDALAMCRLAAAEIGCPPEQFLPSSTGIIGHMLPMDRMANGIHAAAQTLGRSADHAQRFADAILTTDTRRKTAGLRVKIGGQTITLAGVCKGSGMIGPRMALLPPHATMLAYLTTDAALPAGQLGKMLQSASDDTFNAVTVDDHTSTNDTACLLASGSAGRITSPAGRNKFADALKDLCQQLAYQIAADGEGATKVVKITVRQAKTIADAKTMARAIANSPLVKCAMNGNDPNWGRIVSAAGMCGATFDPSRATLKLQGATVFRNGRPAPFDGPKVSQSLAAPEVQVELACRLGDAQSTCWTCDLSKEYVTINAEYHT
jgi:glutamate N-acetyltransferase/amino-acid N-acetyltransferase